MGPTWSWASIKSAVWPCPAYHIKQSVALVTILDVLSSPTEIPSGGILRISSSSLYVGSIAIKEEQTSSTNSYHFDSAGVTIGETFFTNIRTKFDTSVDHENLHLRFYLLFVLDYKYGEEINGLILTAHSGRRGAYQRVGWFGDTNKDAENLRGIACMVCD